MVANDAASAAGGSWGEGGLEAAFPVRVDRAAEARRRQPPAQTRHPDPPPAHMNASGAVWGRGRGGAGNVADLAIQERARRVLIAGGDDAYAVAMLPQHVPGGARPAYDWEERPVRGGGGGGGRAGGGGGGGAMTVAARAVAGGDMSYDQLLALDDEVREERNRRRVRDDDHTWKKTALRRQRYKLRDGEDAEDCTVCLETFAVGEACIRVTCKHVFHRDCIETWLKRDVRCPNCRFNLALGKAAV